jgi:hypothetical protein
VSIGLIHYLRLIAFSSKIHWQPVLRQTQMQQVFQELQELITGLNAFAPALEQAIDYIKSLRAELNSLRGQELAEDEKQAQDEQALLASLRTFSATINTMTQKVTETVVEDPTASEIPTQPVAASVETVASAGSLPRIDPLPTIQPTPAS